MTGLVERLHGFESDMTVVVGMTAKGEEGKVSQKASIREAYFLKTGDPENASFPTRVKEHLLSNLISPPQLQVTKLHTV